VRWPSPDEHQSTWERFLRGSLAWAIAIGVVALMIVGLLLVVVMMRLPRS
jgi:hypothetical protein